MKVLKVIFIVVTVLFLTASQVQAQPQVFDSQETFDAYLVANANVLGNIEVDPGGELDFIFEVTCGIDAADDVGDAVTITGATIAFNADVSLVVDGHIDATDAVFRDNTEDEEDPWGSIVLRGDGGGPGGAGWSNGSALFNNCTIENGGSAGEVEDWTGMIVLTNGEDSTVPELIMEVDDPPGLDENVMRGSQSDAIWIYRANINNAVVPTISLQKAILTGEDEVEGSGIHYEGGVPGNIETFFLDVTLGSAITNFGGNGIVHELLMLDCGFGVFIQDSEISGNDVQGISIVGFLNNSPELGLTVDNCNISGNGNAVQGQGIGINVQNINNSQSTVTITNDCQIFENWWVGIRLDDVCSQNVIEESSIYDNGHSALEGPEFEDDFLWGAGIRARLLINCNEEAGTLIVEDCEIYKNGHEGICVSVNIHQDPENLFDFETIIGNEIYNNGTEVEYDLEAEPPTIDADDPMEGANIHIFENCNHVNVLNNVINGGVTGIAWNANDLNSTPINGRIRNNIQVGNEGDDDNEPSAYGLYVHRHLVPAEAFLDFYTHFYNNIFMENAIAGAFINPLIVVGFEVEQFCNNLIGENGVGLAGLAVQFPYNGFWDNTAGSGFIADPVGTVNADPIFVDQGNSDYHLDWNSPMINRGIEAVPGDEDWGDAFDAPFGIIDAPFGIGEEFGFIDNTRGDIGAYGGGLAKGPYLNAYLAGIGGLTAPNDYGFDPYCAMDENSADICNDNLPDNDDPGDREWLEEDYYRIMDNVSTPLDEELDIGEPEEEDGQAYFEFTADTRWWVLGLIRANGHNGLDDGDPPVTTEEDRNIVFTRLDPNSAWEEFRVLGPIDEGGKLYGCVFDGAEYNLYMSGVIGGGGAPDVLQVYNCEFRNATERGIYVTNRVQLDCQRTLIEDNAGCGIYFTFNEQVIEDERSSIDGVIIQGNCGDSYDYDAGVKCYNSNVMINGCLIHSNLDYGVYATSGGNPYIQGGAGSTNNILNNGDILDQSSTKGAEIRVSTSTAMDEIPPITDNNIYDIRDPNVDDDYERYGRIISRTSSLLQFVVDENYFGDALEDDHPECGFDEAFVEGDDFYEYGGVDLDLQDVIVDGALAIDEWDAAIASDPLPENRFQQGLFAMGRGDLQSAASIFRGWISGAPESPQAPAAVRHLFKVESRLGVDFDRLRGEYMQLVSDTEEEFPLLAWAAKKMAVRCLIEQRLFEEAVTEYQEIRDEAPDEIEALLVDIDMAYAEDLAAAPEINGAGKNNDKIDAAFAQIEEIEARQLADRDDHVAPCRFDLTATYPNPFNSEIRIGFSLSRASQMSLSVYDVNGRQVGRIAEGSYIAGQHQLVWNAAHIPAGSYFLNLEIDGHSVTRKIAIIK